MEILKFIGFIFDFDVFDIFARINVHNSTLALIIFAYLHICISEASLIIYFYFTYLLIHQIYYNIKIPFY